MRFISYNSLNSLIHILWLSNLHSNVASIQKNWGDKLHRADRREANAEKAKGNIFLHWQSNSVNKSFIALLIILDNFIEKNRPCGTKPAG